MSLFVKPAYGLLIIVSVMLAACSDSTEVNGAKEYESSSVSSAEGALADKVSSNQVLAGQALPDKVALEKGASDVTALDVYKSPTCGCCASWIEHVEKSAFAAKVIHPVDLSLEKSQRGIQPMYRSCHTAVSKEGYVFEGHVPAKYIERFLVEKPQGAIGLAVPGMPAGSPGMEMGDMFTPYPVLLLKKDGSSQVYAQINSFEDQ